MPKGEPVPGKLHPLYAYFTKVNRILCRFYIDT